MPDATRARDFWRSLEPKGQMTLVGAALAVFVTAYLLFQLGSGTSYTTLSANLAATDAGSISKTLSSS